MLLLSGWFLLQAAMLVVLIWLSWRYFDRRYKERDDGKHPQGLYDGSLEKTQEVFIDPKDGFKYRVYYNRTTGEREYIREQ
ncbi:HD family phosphohydrolase [Ferviditalea candida]|uniref:HD family phosphohydrolase n=1 Tax=Ferviditalea candida TaxID=3108399 RepID=A0ABU5ZIE0_9BACL|nr:HD family phosphohydrolase [Paenibacillaceae bacterium T2]